MEQAKKKKVYWVLRFNSDEWTVELLNVFNML